MWRMNLVGRFCKAEQKTSIRINRVHDDKTEFMMINQVHDYHPSSLRKSENVLKLINKVHDEKQSSMINQVHDNKPS